jgi:uncharacterized spore protein YtfJ
MSEEPKTSVAEAGYTPVTQLSASSMVVIEETLEKFIQTADVNAVYGQPIQSGEMLIIPAAEVLCGMGFGVGAGSGPESDGHAAPGGGGGGGGGRTFSRPAAVILAGPQGVEVRPVVDITKIALAGITALGFMVSLISRMRRG